MQKNNPAVFECAKTKSTIYTWIRRDDGSAYCLNYNSELTKIQADDVWRG